MQQTWQLAFKIAWRFSRGSHKQRFATFVSGFSTIGITLGVAALITVISVMNGFQTQLEQRILNVVPHLQIPAHDKVPAALAHLPKSPLVSAMVVIQSRQQLQAVQMQGLSPLHEYDRAIMAQHLIQGSLSALKSNQFNVILGSEVARQLGVSVGDNVRLMATNTLVYTPFGEIPSQRTFHVVGIFQFAAEVDSQFIWVNDSDAARLLRQPLAMVQQTRLFVPDPLNIEQYSRYLPKGGLDWRHYYGQLFSAVKMEKTMMSLLFCLVIAVAAFNILSALVMMVGDKQADVAILQTLGMQRGQLLRIFMIQGAWSGCLGALIGVGLGITLAHHLNPVLSLLGLNMALGSGGVPIVIESVQVTSIAWLAMCLSVLATVYPAWQASRIQPAEALRYE
ncbi:lipoprotein-releasing ABC transporter permease subunit [Celerinatantimonas yamalensis]|uniref:Lipoprotein-releasing ABC transporter permease subunit n=1 Tax=Celerinatantimonas yamalensis TaxID=559956 RepID=A0ABW9G3U6_9GAMM